MKFIIILGLLFFSSSLYSQINSNALLLEQEKASPQEFALAAEKADSNEIQEYSYGKEFFNMILNLSILIIIVLAVAWGYRKINKSRFRSANNGNLIKILERRPIHAKAALYLIEAGSKVLVIAESPSGLSMLAETSIDKQTDFSAQNEKNKNTPPTFPEIP